MLPGGGFGKVVPDMEGSEAARRLNDLGISAFVLSYRTASGADAPITTQPWLRPLQDSQRAIRYLRHHAKSYGLDPAKIGLLGFSAGGQVAAIHLTQEKAYYEAIDEIDKESFPAGFQPPRLSLAGCRRGDGKAHARNPSFGKNATRIPRAYR